MQCLILAGGLGTRMRDWTQAIPKSLIPVLDRPFVDYQLAWLAEQGVRDIVFSIGYRGDMIREYVGNGSKWGILVRYVDEGNNLKGTGGAVREAFDADVLEPEFFVLYGDSFLPIPFLPVRSRFLHTGFPALMTVFLNQNRWDASNVIFENGQIELYCKNREHARAGEMAFVDYGLSIMTREAVESCIPSGRRVDLADVFQRLSEEGRLGGFEVKQRFYEVGSPQGLKDFSEYVQSGSGSAPTGERCCGAAGGPANAAGSVNDGLEE